MRLSKMKVLALPAALAASLVPVVAFAQSDAELNAALDELSANVSSADVAGLGLATGGLFGGLFAGLLVVVIFAVIIEIIIFSLWLWALIDVLKRNFKNKSTKSTWSWLVGLSWPLPIIFAWIPMLQWLAGLLGLAGLVIIIIYLASIRKQGTR